MIGVGRCDPCCKKACCKSWRFIRDKEPSEVTFKLSIKNWTIGKNASQDCIDNWPSRLSGLVQSYSLPHHHSGKTEGASKDDYDEWRSPQTKIFLEHYNNVLEANDIASAYPEWSCEVGELVAKIRIYKSGNSQPPRILVCPWYLVDDDRLWEEIPDDTDGILFVCTHLRDTSQFSPGAFIVESFGNNVLNWEHTELSNLSNGIGFHTFQPWEYDCWHCNYPNNYSLRIKGSKLLHPSWINYFFGVSNLSCQDCYTPQALLVYEGAGDYGGDMFRRVRTPDGVDVWLEVGGDVNGQGERDIYQIKIVGSEGSVVHGVMNYLLEGTRSGGGASIVDDGAYLVRGPEHTCGGCMPSFFIGLIVGIRFTADQLLGSTMTITQSGITSNWENCGTPPPIYCCDCCEAANVTLEVPWYGSSTTGNADYSGVGWDGYYFNSVWDMETAIEIDGCEAGFPFPYKSRAYGYVVIWSTNEVPEEWGNCETYYNNIYKGLRIQTSVTLAFCGTVVAGHWSPHPCSDVTDIINHLDSDHLDLVYSYNPGWYDPSNNPDGTPECNIDGITMSCSLS